MTISKFGLAPLLPAALATALGFPFRPCHAQAAPAANQADNFRLGEKLTLKGQTYYVAGKMADGRLTLSPPQPPTASLGAFIQPVGATASSFQFSPIHTIDGSGWGESFPGSGVYVHAADGPQMWASGGGDSKGWIQFDLGRTYNVSGAYIWNYNESGDWRTRSINRIQITSSLDGQTWTPVGEFPLGLAPGTPDYRGETVPFGKPVQARYFKLQSLGNYRNGEQTGLAEIRFADADHQAPAPAGERTAKYLRPVHPKLALGQPLAGSENIVYPADAGVIDVSKAPYNAKGDGVTDDTEAIQKALLDHPNEGATLYLPNGVYLVSHTLRWGGGDDPQGGGAQKQIILQGQSRAGTVICLRDAAVGFDDPRSPQGVLWTGRAPAQRFGNEVCNLTVDTGVNNPGADGIRFMANNQGGVRDVTIVSGDGYGPVGLNLGYSDEQGPCLIKNVKVIGFDTGILTAHSVASVVMENIAVENQNVTGLYNDGQPLSVRGLHSLNSVPGVISAGGLLTLLDSTLTGQGADKNTPALTSSGTLLARNLITSGYAAALADRAGGKTVAGPVVAEYRFPAPVTLLAGANKTLGLPIKETPELAWDDPKTWASALKFGAKPDTNEDSGEAIQKALDSGATTIFLPTGYYRVNQTLVIRGAVRRVLGGNAWFRPGPAISADQPLFRVADGTAPVVLMERLNADYSDWEGKTFVEHASRRTLVLSQMMGAGVAYRGTGGGTVFIEDMVGAHFLFHNQTAWARQLNPEGHGTHVTNDGAQVWVLGMKAETAGTILQTLNGGRTEILGGLSQTNGGHLGPMFVNDGSDLSVTFSEVNNSDDPFLQFVAETRGMQKKEWGDPNKGFKGFRPVFYEGRLTPKGQP